MSATTYPRFGSMLPDSEDFQSIVDAFTIEDRKRLTLDGIWEPGIVNKPAAYLTAGAQTNTLRVLPFIGYTKAGNRIEINQIWTNLSPQDNGAISITQANLETIQDDIPIWRHHTVYNTVFADIEETETKILLENLLPSATLHAVSLKHNVIFAGAGNLYVSIGTENEPEKFSPKRLISNSPEETEIEVSNVVSVESNINKVGVYAWFYGDSSLSGLSQSGGSGSLNVNLCIANSSLNDVAEDVNVGGLPLSSNTGVWKPNLVYHIVARYKTNESDLRSINIHQDGRDIHTEPFNSRITDSFELYALRKTGSIQDPTTDDDIKIGKVITDASGNITIFANGYDEAEKEYYTQYFKLPYYRVSSGETSYFNRVTNCILSKNNPILTYTAFDPSNTVVTINPTATVLIPNGIEQNGTLNNLTYDLSGVKTINCAGTATRYVGLLNGLAFTIETSRVQISKTQPIASTIRLWFNNASNANQWYYRENDGGTFIASQVVLLGKITSVANSGITAVEEYDVMQLMTKKEFEELSSSQSQISQNLNEKSDKIFQQINNISDDNNTATITLSPEASFYQITPVDYVNLIIDASGITIENNTMCTFELGIDLTAGVQTINWPANVSWLNNSSPLMVNAKYYWFVARSRDNGNNWVLNLQGTSN